MYFRINEIWNLYPNRHPKQFVPPVSCPGEFKRSVMTELTLIISRHIFQTWASLATYILLFDIDVTIKWQNWASFQFAPGVTVWREFLHPVWPLLRFSPCFILPNPFSSCSYWSPHWPHAQFWWFSQWLPSKSTHMCVLIWSCTARLCFSVPSKMTGMPKTFRVSLFWSAVTAVRKTIGLMIKILSWLK